MVLCISAAGIWCKGKLFKTGGCCENMSRPHRFHRCCRLGVCLPKKAVPAVYFPLRALGVISFASWPHSLNDGERLPRKPRCSDEFSDC